MRGTQTRPHSKEVDPSHADLEGVTSPAPLEVRRTEEGRELPRRGRKIRLRLSRSDSRAAACSLCVLDLFFIFSRAVHGVVRPSVHHFTVAFSSALSSSLTDSLTPESLMIIIYGLATTTTTTMCRYCTAAGKRTAWRRIRC